MAMQYILNAQEVGRQRLAIQHKLYVESSLNLLSQAGVKSGMKGLEIGCGSGAMTQELANLVDVSGSLLAIDVSKEQVDHVSRLFLSDSNIRCKVFDVNELSSLNEKFDFIYVRMVLVHLKNARFAIEQMQKCLNPGGVIICEEPSFETSLFCSIRSEAFDKFSYLINKCFEKNKSDYKIASQLDHAFKQSGFNVIHYSLFQPLFKTTYEKQNFPMVLFEIKQQLINFNIAGEAEIDKVYDELIKLAESDCCISGVRMHQIIAK